MVLFLIFGLLSTGSKQAAEIYVVVKEDKLFKKKKN